MLLYRVLGQDGLGAGGPVPAILPLVGGGVAALQPAVVAAPAAPVAAEGVNALGFPQAAMGGGPMDLRTIDSELEEIRRELRARAHREDSEDQRRDRKDKKGKEKKEKKKDKDKKDRKRSKDSHKGKKKKKKRSRSRKRKKDSDNSSTTSSSSSSSAVAASDSSDDKMIRWKEKGKSKRVDPA
eukprot:16435030-Heterocapsa_arctica.AAC.1